MNHQSAQFQHKTSQASGLNIQQYFPFLGWLLHYNRKHLTGDIIAGVIVAIMLVPQSMAYALLAGLPPQVGLYTSIVPLVIYGLLGTSRALAVGPVAMVSLLVASALGHMGLSSVAEYVQWAILLSLMVGMIQLAMGVSKVGFLVNFLSHPVLSGFTSAVAIVIGLSQFKHLIGVSVPRTESTIELVGHIVAQLSNTNGVVLALSLVAVTVLLYFKFFLAKHLTHYGLNENIISPLTKLGPLVVAVLGLVIVAMGGLHEAFGVPIVGDVPAGLPSIVIPTFDFDIISELLPFALTLSIVGYLESISVAKALASRRRQKVDANQELIALGAANIGSSLTGGYPVAGGFSRSMVNFTAGANTPLASIISAGLIAMTMLFLTSTFYFLPNAALGAIIIVTVITLFDLKTMRYTWQYSKADFVSLIMTFVSVLFIGVESGIVIGVLTSLMLYLWRTSRPHVAIVGQIGDTEEYRNILRHNVKTHSNIIAMRVDESLYFPNAQYLEEVILNTVADDPDTEYFVLICSAVNFIDVSALETLESLHHSLAGVGVEMYYASIKGPVMDRLRKIGFVDEIGENYFFLSIHEAMENLKSQ
jgi:sulfate permease, SulP family